MSTQDTEEVLFEYYDSSWGRNMKCILITCHLGNMDLHIQTGSDHTKALERATAILSARGFKVDDWTFLGPSGLYYAVRKNVS